MRLCEEKTNLRRMSGLGLCWQSPCQNMVTRSCRAMTMMMTHRWSRVRRRRKKQQEELGLYLVSTTSLIDAGFQ